MDDAELVDQELIMRYLPVAKPRRSMDDIECQSEGGAEVFSSLESFVKKDTSRKENIICCFVMERYKILGPIFIDLVAAGLKEHCPLFLKCSTSTL